MSSTNQIHQVLPATRTITPAVQSTARASQAFSNPVTKGGSAAEPATDHAELSPASKLVATALRTSDVRVDKVDSLQRAIASGTYNVSSSDLANKLIDTLQFNPRG